MSAPPEPQPDTLPASQVVTPPDSQYGSPAVSPPHVSPESSLHVPTAPVEPHGGSQELTGSMRKIHRYFTVPDRDFGGLESSGSSTSTNASSDSQGMSRGLWMLSDSVTGWGTASGTNSSLIGSVYLREAASALNNGDTEMPDVQSYTGDQEKDVVRPAKRQAVTRLSGAALVEVPTSMEEDCNPDSHFNCRDQPSDDHSSDQHGTKFVDQKHSEDDKTKRLDNADDESPAILTQEWVLLPGHQNNRTHQSFVNSAEYNVASGEPTTESGEYDMSGSFCVVDKSENGQINEDIASSKPSTAGMEIVSEEA